MKKKPKVAVAPKVWPLITMKNPTGFETELDVYGLLVDEDGYDGRLPEAQRKKLLRMYRKRKPAPDPLAALRDKVVEAAVRAVKGYGGFAETLLSLDGHAAKLIRAVRAYKKSGGK